MGGTSSLSNLKSLHSADEMDKFANDAKTYFDRHLGDANRRYRAPEKVYFFLTYNFFKSKRLPEVTHDYFNVSFQMVESGLGRSPELNREDFTNVCERLVDNLLDPQEANEFLQNKLSEALCKALAVKQEESKVDQSAETSAETSAQRQDPILNNINEKRNPNLLHSRNNLGRNETAELVASMSEAMDKTLNKTLDKRFNEQDKILEARLEKNNQELTRTTNEIQQHLRELEQRIDQEITKVKTDFENRSNEISQAQIDKIVQRVTQETFERMKREFGYTENDMESFRRPMVSNIRHSENMNSST